jgi:UDP-3-O-acyl-N-acetylglucosamine deacetylase
LTALPPASSFGAGTLPAPFRQSRPVSLASEMDRTELNHPVVVEGPSFLGFPARCVLAPSEQRGIHLRLPDGAVVPLGAMTLSVNRLFRFLTLRHGRHVLRIPEHLLGLLFALGLDSVTIAPGEFRLPYDGRAKLYWDAIKAARRHAGPLDWFTPAAPLKIAAGDDGRAIELIPAAPGERRFAFEIEVGYPELGTKTLRGIVGEESDLERLFTARPYWKTQMRRRVARIARRLGWPQGDIGVWLTSDGSAAPSADAKALVLDELCWHRLLDMLGMFAAVMPPGGRIAGAVTTRRVGHAADVALMQAMKRTTLVRV